MLVHIFNMFRRDNTKTLSTNNVVYSQIQGQVSMLLEMGFSSKTGKMCSQRLPASSKG